MTMRVTVIVDHQLDTLMIDTNDIPINQSNHIVEECGYQSYKTNLGKSN